MTQDPNAAEMSRSFANASKFWEGWFNAYIDGLARAGAILASMFAPRY